MKYKCNLRDNGITADFVRNYFLYDAESGELTWAHRKNLCGKASAWNRKCAGKKVGWLDHHGHRMVRATIEGVIIRTSAHRLIFLLMTGATAPEVIDHIDGRKDNNKWANLRAVTQSENMMNTRILKNNTSGLTGVYWNASRGYWQAQIKQNGINKGLGISKSKFEAAALRKSAELRLGFHHLHGQKRA